MTDDEIRAVYNRYPYTEQRIEFARAIIAADQAKLLAGVEMPEPVDAKTEIKHIPNVGTWYEDTQLFTQDQLQQYAAACAAQAREKALEDAERAVRARWPNTRYAEPIEQLKVKI